MSEGDGRQEPYWRLEGTLGGDMLDLAASLVSALAWYLYTSQNAPARPNDKELADVCQRIRQGLSDNEAFRAFDAQARAGTITESTRQSVQAPVLDLLHRDPSLAHAAERVLHVSDTTTAAGDGGNRQRTHVSYKKVRAGRDVTTKVKNSSRQTRLAIGGGGLLLALALIYVWFQYSADKRLADARADYERKATATCQQIRSAFSQPPSPDSFFTFSRDEFLALLDTRQKVVVRQVNAFLKLPVPIGLEDHRAIIAVAAKNVGRANSSLAAQVRRMPAHISVFQLVQGSGAAHYADSYRRLGEELTGASGSVCDLTATPAPTPS